MSHSMTRYIRRSKTTCQSNAVAAFAVLALAAQAYVEEPAPNSMEKSVDHLTSNVGEKLYGRVIKKSSRSHTGLEDVMLGKPGHLAVRSANPAPLQGFHCPAVPSSRLQTRFPWGGRSLPDKSPIVMASSVRPELLDAIGNEPAVADEKALLEKSTFPIKPDQLIGLAKAFLAAQEAGTATGEGGPDWFASDFRFVAPVVGPFDKAEFIDSLKSFELKKAFSDLKGNPHHFRVCPFEPNRVWYSIKYFGTNDGPVLGQPATGKSVESPVQTHSLTFNEKGEVTKLTIGYVMDKETGNTGGLGGVFGLFYAIGLGLPFPEAQPYKPSPVYGTLMSVNRAIQDGFKASPAFKSAVQGVLTTVGGKKN
eukprot:gnl/TRDRNA2_/TRDRNA2_38747_c0_seq1.p1 gnl/TRDRNA2_/TRDRNA2_38747_c0~~gnl/TRDRNA2_/TRDRNA2_38747_c0_seq1.p1  ORF type:complete len:365 (-),score=58.71 gnl/TRDRNA2_/TRDRNA2_38747_c0_seq1:41-1135(-)